MHYHGAGQPVIPGRSSPVSQSGLRDGMNEASAPNKTPAPEQLDAAARLLTHAVRAGCEDPNVLMMLALAQKRRRHWAKARQALLKIPHPDTAVFLQLGLLSL